MKEAQIQLKSMLVEATLSLRELNDLQAGDVIPIDLPDLVTLEAEDTPVFRGKFGVHNSSRSIKILQKIVPDQIEK